MIDWRSCPNFTADEMACQHCGKHGVTAKLMNKLQLLRTTFGRPLHVTSGFRCVDHPVEIVKAKPGTGTHARGLAVDIRAGGAIYRYELLKIAFDLGFVGITPAKTFIHLDVRDGPGMTWSY